MKHTYEIIKVNEKDKWIFIETEDFDEPDAFVALVKNIAEACGGTIKEVGTIQYKIVGDKFDLIYQWDDLFGFVVIYKDNVHDVMCHLQNFFN